MPKGVKAKASDKPGETKKITFYQLSSNANTGTGTTTTGVDDHGDDDNEQEQQQKLFKLRLVDLPGYGFSFSSRQEHDGFQALLFQYLLERGKALKRVLLLIDARHGLKRADFDLLERLQEEERQPTMVYNTPQGEHAPSDNTSSRKKRKIPALQIVLTKCDLVSRDDLARRVVQVRQHVADTMRRETSNLPVLMVSARPGVGFNNIRRDNNNRFSAPHPKEQFRARGGVLELQKQLAALVVPSALSSSTTSSSVSNISGSTAAIGKKNRK